MKLQFWRKKEDKKKEKIEVLTKEILNMDKEDPSFSVFEILSEIGIKDSYSAYISTMKYQEDCGFINGFWIVSTRSYVKGLFYPGDIIFYSFPFKIRTDDTVLVAFRTKKKNVYYAIHCKVRHFLKDGAFEVEIINTMDKYIISSWYIIGKVIRVVPFMSLEWKTIFYPELQGTEFTEELSKAYKELKEELKEIEDPQIIGEIQSRLKLIYEFLEEEKT